MIHARYLFPEHGHCGGIRVAMWLLICFATALVALLLAVAWRQVYMTREMFMMVQVQGRSGLAGPPGPQGPTGPSGTLMMVGDAGPPENTFVLQDLISGQVVSYDAASDRVVEDSVMPAVNWSLYQDGSVYDSGLGTVALMDNATNLYMRHAGMVVHEAQFAADKVDFAWLFKRTQNQNVYTIFNYDGSNEYLNFDGQQLRIDSSNDTPPRKWLVQGSASVLGAVYAASVN